LELRRGQTFEDFKKNWEEQMAKVDKQDLDDDAITSIRLQSGTDKKMFETGSTEAGVIIRTRRRALMQKT